MRAHADGRSLYASIKDIAWYGQESGSSSNVHQKANAHMWRGERSQTIDRDSGFGSSLSLDDKAPNRAMRAPAKPPRTFEYDREREASTLREPNGRRAQPEAAQPVSGAGDDTVMQIPAKVETAPGATQTEFAWRKADLARARETRWDNGPSDDYVALIPIPAPRSTFADAAPTGALRTILKQKQWAAANAVRAPLPRALAKRVSFAPIHPLDRQVDNATSLRHATSEHDLVRRINIRVAERVIQTLNAGTRLTPQQIDGVCAWIEATFLPTTPAEPGSTGGFIESLV
ncbi:MAG TPA: hypothetical protein VL424_03490 [Pararobbsia sp.]|nr:hypothetical protein [Pararobbsia sp.]